MTKERPALEFVFRAGLFACVQILAETASCIFSFKQEVTSSFVGDIYSPFRMNVALEKIPLVSFLCRNKFSFLLKLLE